MQASKPQRQPARRARGSLTEDAIVATAFAIAADSSLEEVSVPRVAKSLGVGVTSIYWHVRNKSELLDAMTDRALRRSGFPPYVESGEWRESLMAHARGVRQTFIGDPVLTDLILIRGTLSPLARRLGEQETRKAIANMVDSGLDEQTARDMYSAVSELVQGSVLLTRMAQKHRATQESASADGGFTSALSPPGDRAFETLLTSLLYSVGVRGSPQRARRRPHR